MSNVKAIQVMPLYLHEEVQDIENALKAKVITKENVCDVRRRLGATLKAVNEHSSPFAEAMKEEIVTLCGRVENAWVESEMTQIHAEASCLQDAIQSGKVTANAVHQLAAHLGALKKEHLPSRENRQLLRGAEQVVELASAFLNNDSSSINDLSLPKKKEVEEVLPLDAIDCVVLGEMEELMDIAGLVYNGNKIEAKTRFAQLPESLKKKFLHRLAQMGATAFEDVMPTCQVLLLLGYESVGSDNGLPTTEEVEEFFSGLTQVLSEEEEETKVISLSGRVSLVG